MAFAIRKLQDEPIVIVTVTVPLHEFVEDIAAINAEVSRYAAQTEGPLYRISDASLLHDLSYSDILLWIMAQKENPGGSIYDPRVRSVFVRAPSKEMGELAARKVSSQWNADIPSFDSLEDALAYVRSQIAASSNPLAD